MEEVGRERKHCEQGERLAGAREESGMEREGERVTILVQRQPVIKGLVGEGNLMRWIESFR